MFKAAKEGDICTIETLLESGVDIEQGDVYGRNPLYYAAQYGHYDVVKLLLDSGATEQRDAFYTTAYNGHNDIVKLFLQHNFEINSVDRYGWSALHFVSSSLNVEAVKLLIECGANANLCVNSIAPLHRVLCPGIASLLLDNGADIEIKNKFGWTPMHIALDRGCLQVAKVLIDRGARLDVKNNAGKTPLEVVRKDKYKRFVLHYAKMHDQGEWRPCKHAKYPSVYRQAMKTLVLLAKT